MNRQLLARLGPCMALAALLSACAGKPTQVVRPHATVSNLTGKPVAIRYQRCGSPADQWQTTERQNLVPGASMRFVMPEECVNFEALYADGRVAGSQRSIRDEYPFEWVLR